MKKFIITTGIVLSMLGANAGFAQTHHKISSQGKGAIVGGAGGAVVGGIATHSVGGALVGGAVGAGAGYVIGNEHRRHVEKERRLARYRRHHHHVYAKR